MALFKKARNHATIVAPLKQMVDNLSNYVSEQQAKISKLQQDRQEIESIIAESENEIAKSKFTNDRIRDLIGADIDA